MKNLKSVAAPTLEAQPELNRQERGPHSNKRARV